MIIAIIKYRYLKHDCITYSDGYKEITVGVDKDNLAAIHLYRKKGFTKVLFDGCDEQGEYFKLLKTL